MAQALEHFQLPQQLQHSPNYFATAKSANPLFNLQTLTNIMKLQGAERAKNHSNCEIKSIIDVNHVILDQWSRKKKETVPVPFLSSGYLVLTPCAETSLILVFAMVIIYSFQLVFLLACFCYRLLLQQIELIILYSFQLMFLPHSI